MLKTFICDVHEKLVHRNCGSFNNVITDVLRVHCDESISKVFPNNLYNLYKPAVDDVPIYKAKDLFQYEFKRFEVQFRIFLSFLT